MAFDTSLITTSGEGTRHGPERYPKQLLGDQQYDGHASVHDDEVAGELGLTGAPIEGPTHFSQFDPLAFDIWGQQWFETGCISARFLNMVVEGKSVIASLTPTGHGAARIDAAKGDGTPVLTGTATVDPARPTEVRDGLAKAQARDPGELFILDQIELGPTPGAAPGVSIDLDTDNGHLYPFSLRRKLEAITERTPWYDRDDTPWNRPILPFEMYSVLAHKVGARVARPRPAVGLFIDLEVRAVHGPLFVGEHYRLEHEVVAVGQSRRVESHWVETRIFSEASGRHAANVLLHSGVFKASYAAYPADHL